MFGFIVSFLLMFFGAVMNYVNNGDVKMFILWVAGCILNLLGIQLLQIKNEIKKVKGETK
jgi:putative Mn2+ efflux pump MntP